MAGNYLSHQGTTDPTKGFGALAENAFRLLRMAVNAGFDMCTKFVIVVT